MSCYRPLKAFLVGTTENGKPKYKIASRKAKYCGTEDGRGNTTDFIFVPCGQCIGCRLDYARQWAVRCCLEASYYDKNYFVTLTYDDEHNSTKLVKEDLSRFFHSLRRHYQRLGLNSPRFFACGEYGSTTLRPHYHAIIFNLPLDDLKLYKRTNQGALYNSELLSSIWNKGHVVVGEVNFQTCGYVARYCTKKMNHHELEKYGFTPEFTLMSRRPGIGYSYFNEHYKQIYDCDKIYFSFGGLGESSPPRYFDKLMDSLDPFLLNKVKDTRKLLASITSSLELYNTDLKDKFDYLLVKEEDKLSHLKKLKRSL